MQGREPDPNKCLEWQTIIGELLGDSDGQPHLHARPGYALHKCKQVDTTRIPCGVKLVTWSALA